MKPRAAVKAQYHLLFKVVAEKLRRLGNQESDLFNQNEARAGELKTKAIDDLRICRQ